MRKTNEKGSITLYVLVSMLFIFLLIGALYVSSSNKVQKQESDIKKIEQQYSKEDINQIYEEKVNK